MQTICWTRTTFHLQSLLKPTGTRWKIEWVDSVQTKFLRCLILHTSEKNNFSFLFFDNLQHYCSKGFVVSFPSLYPTVGPHRWDQQLQSVRHKDTGQFNNAVVSVCGSNYLTRIFVSTHYVELVANVEHLPCGDYKSTLHLVLQVVLFYLWCASLHSLSWLTMFSGLI